MASIFECQDYRKALKQLMNSSDHAERGLQTRLAKSIGCQQAYLSRVLAGLAELSQEQALGIASFFNLDQLEREYFLTLVNFNRASTPDLRRFYREKLDEVTAKKFEFKSRVQAEDSLTADQKSTYYSDWIYCAIHVATAVEGYQTVAALADRLRLPERRVVDTLEFLESCGLVSKQKNRYINKTAFIHLGNDSNLIRMHHTNWRLRAIDALSNQNSQNLNYSSVISCSASDAVKIRETMLEAVQKIRAIVKASSPDEQVYCYNLDFFEP